MSASTNRRPGGDFGILQADTVRGCDTPLAAGVPGDLLIVGGLNTSTSAVGSVIVNNRSDDRSEPILTFAHGAAVTAPESVELYAGSLASPNGVVTATQGALYISNNPAAVYQNTDGAVAWALVSGGAGGESLAETLVIGNVTGGTDIVMSNGDNITGVDSTTGNGTGFSILGGGSTAAVGDGGSLLMFSGQSANGTSGQIRVESVSSPNGSGTVQIGSGDTTSGAVGTTTVKAGQSSAADGGTVRVQAGETTSAALQSGGDLHMTAGGASNGAQGGHGYFFAGDATADVGLPGFAPVLNSGGSILIRAGRSANLLAGGSANIQAGDGGSGGGVGGNVNLIPGAGGGVASAGVVQAFGNFQSSNILRGDGDPNVLGLIADEGSLFQRTTGGNGEVWLNTDGTTWVQLGATGALAESFVGAQWGSIQATGDTNAEGNFTSTFGFWEGIEEFGLSMNRFEDEFGPFTRLFVSPGLFGNLNSYLNLAPFSSTHIRRSQEPVASFKFKFSSLSPIVTGVRGFIGLSSTDSNGILASDLPAGSYVGLQKLQSSTQFRLVFRGPGGTSIPSGQFNLPTDIQLQLIIDMTITDTVVMTLRNPSNGAILQSATVATAQIPALTDPLYPIFAVQSDGVAEGRWDMYAMTAVLNASQFNGGASSATASTLEAVLAQGNVSGANSIVLTDQDLFFGGVLSGENDSVSQGGAGGRVTIAGGSTSNAALNGGAVALFSGLPEAATIGGRSGDLFLGTGNILSAAGTAATGDAQLRTGDHSGLGASGTLLVSSGATQSGTSGVVTVSTGGSASGTSGALNLNTGDASTAGAITIQPGTSTNGAGADISLEAGEGTGAAGAAGNVLIAAGDPAAGFNFAGGNVSLSGSDAEGVGVGGGVNILGALGGTTSGAGGSINLTAGAAQAGASAGGDINMTPGAGFGGGAAGVVNVTGDLNVTQDVSIAGKLNVAGLIDPTGLVLDQQAVQPFDPTGTTQGLLWVRAGTPNTLVYVDNDGNSVDLDGSGSGGSGSVANALLTAGLGSMMPGSPSEGYPATYGVYGSSQTSTLIGGATIVSTVGAADGPVATLTTTALPTSTAYVSTSENLITRRQRFKARFKFRASSASFADHRSFVGFTNTPVSQLLTDDGLGIQYVGLINRDTSLDYEFVMRGSGGAIVPVTAIVADNEIHILEIDSSDPTQMVVTLYDEDGITVEATTTVPDSDDMPDEAMPLAPFVGVRSEAGGSVKTFDHHWHNVLTRADIMDALGGGSGGGGGVSALNDLTDVTVAAPALGEILIYNGATWANAPFPGGGASTLAASLLLGNTTDGSNIVLTGASQIESNNTQLELEVLDAVAGTAADGADIVLNAAAGDPTAATNGGGFQLLAGAAGTSGAGGGFQMLLGSGGSGSGNGGSATIQTGQGVGGNAQGGDFTLTALNGAGTGRGGIVSISGGAGGIGGGNGGNINLTPGVGNGGGTDGEVLVTGDLNITGKLTVAGLIDPTGLVLTRQAVVPYAPTPADGLLWINAAGNLIYTNDSGDLDVSSIGGGGGAGSLSATLTVGDQTSGQNIVLGAAASSASGTNILTASDETVLTITGGRNSTAGAFGVGSVPGSVVITAGDQVASFAQPELVLQTPTAASGIEAGSIDILAGAGGSIGLALPGGVGGAVNVRSGDGGAANGSGVGGTAGTLTLQGGTGGQGAANNGGAGGALSFVGGLGGNAVGLDTPGAGGGLTFTSGMGGTDAGGNPGASGSMLFSTPVGALATTGSFVFQAGSGSSPFAGAAGSVLMTAAQNGTREGATLALRSSGTTTSGDAFLRGGAGGAGDEGGTVFISGADLDVDPGIGTFTAPNQGGDVEVRGGIGNGAGNGGGLRLFGGRSGTGGGTAGSVLIAGGDASVGSGGNGGSVLLFAGDGNGAGSDGSIVLQDTVQFGNTSTEATAGIDTTNSTLIKAGTTAVNTLGVRTTVVFPGDPMAAVPNTIQISIESSVGFVGLPSRWVIVSGLTSASGFSVDFDVTPVAGVTLHWTAMVTV